jgi:hypothetical protein
MGRGRLVVDKKSEELVAERGVLDPPLSLAINPIFRHNSQRKKLLVNKRAERKYSFHIARLPNQIPSLC